LSSAKFVLTMSAWFLWSSICCDNTGAERRYWKI